MAPPGSSTAATQPPKMSDSTVIGSPTSLETPGGEETDSPCNLGHTVTHVPGDSKLLTAMDPHVLADDPSVVTGDLRKESEAVDAGAEQQSGSSGAEFHKEVEGAEREDEGEINELLSRMSSIPQLPDLEELHDQGRALMRNFSEALEQSSEMYEHVQTVRMENAERAAEELVAARVDSRICLKTSGKNLTTPRALWSTGSRISRTSHASKLPRVFFIFCKHGTTDYWGRVSRLGHRSHRVLAGYLRVAVL